LAVVGSALNVQAYVSNWTASSGLRPDQATTNWTYYGNSPSVTPVFWSNYMVLSTSPNTEVSFFESGPASIDIPTDLTIEFKARFGSRKGNSTAVSPMSVYFGLGGGLGSVLYLGLDDVWLAGGNNIRGVGASVDTDDLFHTYRLQLSGSTVGSAINVFYDNSINPLFTGSLLLDSALNGNVERIGFGDHSWADSGVSKWDYLWHNASCVPINSVPEPTSAALLIAGGAMLLARRNRKDAFKAA